MHDSANTQRCSIDRSVQWGQIALPNRCDAEQPGAGGDSGTRFPRRHPFGNRTPLFRRIPGCSFPMGAPGETASHSETLKRFSVSEWDAVSPGAPIGKLHPGIRLNSGVRFPKGCRLGNRVPESPPAPGCSASHLLGKAICPHCTDLSIEHRCVFALSCMVTIG